MTDTLKDLIAEAQSLANDHPCTHGHLWETVGGRYCADCEDLYDISGRSQPVFQCARCREYDYGDPGGPAHQWCSLNCKH